MTKLFTLLEKIRQRPPMYVGSYSITSLHSFLSGYIFARMELGEPQSDDEKLFDQFQTWIEDKFAIHETHSWAKIILFYSMSEQHALEHFFELLDEFLQSHQDALASTPPPP